MTTTKIKQSILHKRVLTEKVDINRIDELLNSTLPTKEQKLKLLQYKKLVKNGFSKIQYFHSKKEGGLNNDGRVYCKGSIGLQMFKKNIRSYLAHEYYKDIDIVNCYPVLLLQLCNKLKIKCKFLKQYVNNRGFYLSKIKIQRDDAKELYIRLLFGGSIDIWRQDFNFYGKLPKFVFDFEKEMDDISNHFYGFYPDFNKLTKNKNSLLSWVIQHHEKEILEKTIYFLQNKNIIKDDIYTPCFDGLLVLKNDNLNNDLLIELNKYIYDELEFKITFVFKELKPPIIKTIIEIHNDDIIINGEDEEDEDIELKLDNAKYFKFDVINEINRVFKCDFMRNKKTEGDSNYNLIKKYIENFYIKVIDPAMFFNIKTFKSLKPDDIKHIFGNVFYNVVEMKGNNLILKKYFFYDMWRRDPYIKTYNKVVFEPPPLKYSKNSFNMFDEVVFNTIHNYKPKKCEYIIKHFKEVICSNNENVINYLKNYIYQLKTQAGVNPMVCLMLFSITEGTGKNAFCDILRNIVNSKFVFENDASAVIDDKSGFNGRDAGKFLIILNEFRMTDKKKYNSFKSRITNKTKQINEKNKTEFTIKNLARTIITSNEPNLIPLSNSDRRCFMIEVSKKRKNDTEYFNKLYEEINDMGCILGFYNWVLENINDNDKIKIDNLKYNFQNERPITNFYKDVIAGNIPYFIRFTYNYSLNHNGDKKIQATEFYNMYKRFMHKNNLSNKILSIIKFGRYIKDINAIKPKKCSNMFYQFNCEKLNKYITHNYRFIDNNNYIFKIDKEDEEDE